MRNVVEYIISAKDATAAAISSSIGKLRDFAKSVGTNLMNIKAGWDMAFGSIRTVAVAVGSTIKEAFKFETVTLQFSVLMKSMDAAKDRMSELATLAAETPFNLSELAESSKQLYVFSDGALGGANSLRLVGDAAAATGVGIKDLSFWVGRAYSMIKGGQAFGEAAMRLQEMGVLTPEVRSEMEKLQAAGASNIEVWELLEKRLETFSGGMKTLSQSGEGMMSTLEDNWTAAVRTFGQAFMDSAKDGIGLLSEKIDVLTQDGTFATWAQTALEWLTAMAEGAKIAGNAISAVWKYSGASDIYRGAKGSIKAGIQGVTSLAVGIAEGDGVKRTLKNAYTDSRDAYMGELSQGFYVKKALGALGDPGGYISEQEQQKEAEKRAKDNFAAENKKKLDDQKKKKDDEKEKINADMAKAQKIADDKKAKDEEDKAREKYEKDYARWCDRGSRRIKKEEEDRLKLEQKLVNEREKLAQKAIQKEFDDRIKGVGDQIKQEESQQTDMQQRLAAAQAQIQKAWGWYRDKDSLKRQMDEEKQQKEAEKRFEKEWDRLATRRSDWRTAKNLSVDDEAVRRLGLAKEEESSAKKSLSQIEVNTHRLSDKLDELLVMKNGA